MLKYTKRKYSLRLIARFSTRILFLGKLWVFGAREEFTELVFGIGTVKEGKLLLCDSVEGVVSVLTAESLLGAFCHQKR